MPCVLPVLTMKVSALLSSSGYETEGQRLAHFREHNVLFGRRDPDVVPRAGLLRRRARIGMGRPVPEYPSRVRGC